RNALLPRRSTDLKARVRSTADSSVISDHAVDIATSQRGAHFGAHCLRRLGNERRHGLQLVVHKLCAVFALRSDRAGRESACCKHHFWLHFGSQFLSSFSTAWMGPMPARKPGWFSTAMESASELA